MKRVILVEFGKAEVSDLGSAVMQEDIGSFEVSVCHSHLPQVPQTLVHIEYQFPKLSLREWPFSFEAFFKIALIAELGDDVAVPI